MRTAVKKISLLPLLALLGCAGGAHQKIVPGKTTSAELTKQLGAPLAVGSSPLGEGAELKTYPDCEFQLENEMVTGKFCKPPESQRSLQYWRQLWRGEKTTWEPLPGQSGLHGKERFVLSAPSLKRSVIYDSAVDQVTAVVEYSSTSVKGASDGK